MAFNEARKITQAQKEMYVAVNAMRSDIKKEALQHYHMSFEKEGFTDRSFWHWTPLKRERKRYKSSKILTNTGRLKKSIKTFSNSSRDGFYVRFSSNVKYAKIHNEGLNGLAYGRHPFKMPKRMFMGYSKVLDRKLQALFDRRIKRIFK